MHPLTPSWYKPRPELKKIDNISSIIGIDTNNIKVIENWISDEDCERAMKIISKTQKAMRERHKKKDYLQKSLARRWLLLEKSYTDFHL
jgi:hypothetical protein